MTPIWDSKLGQIIVARLVFGFVTRRIGLTRVEVKHSFPNTMTLPNCALGAFSSYDTATAPVSKGLPSLLTGDVVIKMRESLLSVGSRISNNSGYASGYAS